MTGQLPPLVPPHAPAGPPVPAGGPDQAPAPSPYRPPSPYEVPAQQGPPWQAPPSTGEGWTIVALLFAWPFAVAAYPHAQRATAALGAGDLRTAAREAARARYHGVTGLVAGIVLMVASIVGVVAFAVWSSDVAQRTEDATSTGWVADDEPGSGPADGTSVWDLTAGDCFLVDGLEEVVRTVAVVPCTHPHGGELYAIEYVTSAQADEWATSTGPRYPGPEPMYRYAEDLCVQAFERAGGTPEEASELIFWHTAPDPWDWRRFDRRINCFAESVDDDRTAPVGGR
ncbi:CD225/dispanin family protein [Promicromonospora citrea]|uniref:Regulator of septum formation n=1 Tax=Promicromonospora citrea TaxID=43677 RepID=A0A8H9GEB5_9MICO|nr:CD225/dispanin family protein [Promicromonospora citrea]NNH53341.1 hypothetical protein [Promicromonospora citrea]GGM13503.1 hypothetical protein GCM10010102_06370 [Promicromonospora citrea]